MGHKSSSSSCAARRRQLLHMFLRRLPKPRIDSVSLSSKPRNVVNLETTRRHACSGLNPVAPILCTRGRRSSERQSLRITRAVENVWSKTISRSLSSATARSFFFTQPQYRGLQHLPNLKVKYYPRLHIPFDNADIQPVDASPARGSGALAR
jgi:hypothetical protein